ncbi:MAG: beta-lactamase-like protein [Monoraphidium minutum]|nr:MAG: beta-lactamase-like protein [Monoraphidium minutum]
MIQIAILLAPLLSAASPADGAGPAVRPLPSPLPPPAADHLRLTALGTGVPRVTRSQYTTSYLLELGSGQSFLFDIGDGALINAIQAAPGTFGNAKLFLTHLHRDHIADAVQLFLTHLHSDHIADAVQLLALGPMLGGRAAGPLHVYGPSGPTPETGTAAFVEGLNRVLAWDRLARERVKRPPPGECAAGGGGDHCPGGDEPADPSPDPNVAVAHEFDFSQERQLVFEEGEARVYSTPVDHYFTGGPVAYRLEWRGLSVVFGGDTAPTPALERLAAGADVVVIDSIATALDGDRGGSGGGAAAAAGGAGGEQGSGGKAGGTSAQERRNIVASHTSPAEAGRLLAAAAPRLGIATHIALNGFSHDYAVTQLRRAYRGPLAVARDLDYWDVGPSRIQSGRLLAAAETWGLIFATEAYVDDAAAGGGAAGGGGGGGGGGEPEAQS